MYCVTKVNPCQLFGSRLRRTVSPKHSSCITPPPCHAGSLYRVPGTLSRRAAIDLPAPQILEGALQNLGRNHIIFFAPSPHKQGGGKKRVKRISQ